GRVGRAGQKELGDFLDLVPSTGVRRGRDEPARELLLRISQGRHQPLRPSPPDGGHISRRPSSARARVTSSAYSRSPPMGRPWAIRVTRTPSGTNCRCRYIDVASPPMLGLGGGIPSSMPPTSPRRSSSLIFSL